MCLAIPARITKIENDDATVDAMGNLFRANVSLIENPKVGDLVLVHAGFAIASIDEEEAQKTWELFEQLDNFQDSPNKVSG